MNEVSKTSPSNTVKYLWGAVLALNFFLIMKVELDDLPYAIGAQLSVLIASLLLSPLVYFPSKRFKNFDWKWYHWLNVVTTLALILDITKWIITPLANDAATKRNANQYPSTQSQPPQKPKDAQEIPQGAGLCYVYWNGWKFLKGKAPSDTYHTFKLARYGVPLVAMALPKEMSDEFMSGAKGDDLDMYKGKFADFFQQQYAAIELLCNH